MVDSILDAGYVVTKTVTTPVAPITDPVVDAAFLAADAVIPPIPVIVSNCCNYRCCGTACPNPDTCRRNKRWVRRNT